MDPVGIEIKARVSGNEAIRNSARELQGLRKEMSQFESIRMEAAEKFPQSLEKQNRYIREQLSLLRQMENIGSRERLEGLRHQRAQAIGIEQQRTVERRIAMERMEHVRSQAEFTEAQAARQEWERQQGIGGWGERGVDMPTMLMQAGIRGGPVGMAGAGLGAAGRAVAGRMAGMGVAGGLAAGAGVGLALYAGYKAIQFVGQGWQLNKQIFPAMAEMLTGLREIPQHGAEFRRQLELSAAAMAENLQTTMALQREWMRFGGLVEADTQRMERVGRIAQVFGMIAQQGIGFVGTMARMGYVPQLRPMLEPRAIQAAVGAGMEGLRIGEFLQQIQAVTPGLLRTAVRLDPQQLIDITGQFANLGLPFQGQRGAELMTRLHGAITGGGMGWEAARRVVQRTMGEQNVWDILVQQQRGILDPENLREQWRIAQRIGGQDIRMQAFQLYHQLEGRLAPREIYNPDRDPNSLVEWLSAGPEGLPRRGRRLTDEEITKRIAEWEKTPERIAEKYTVIKDIAKIEVAAKAFEIGTMTFSDAINRFVERGLLPGGELPAELQEPYEATRRRRLSTFDPRTTSDETRDIVNRPNQ